MPVEQVLSYNPDLIIIHNSDLVKNDNQYAKIAPTFEFKNTLTSSWKQTLLTLGKVFNKTNVAKQAIQQYDQKAQSAKTELQKVVGEKTVAILWIEGKDIYLVSRGRQSGGVLYDDLGLTPPKAANKKALGPFPQLSLEELPELNADYIFEVPEDSAGQAQSNTVTNSPIWQSLKAVKEGHVYKEDYGNWINDGFYADEKTINDTLKALVK